MDVKKLALSIASPVRADGDWRATWQEWWDATGFGRRTVSRYVALFRSYHTGIDFNHKSGVDLGRSVYAAADGKVCFADELRGWLGGAVIVIEHTFGDGRLWTRYAHVEPLVQFAQQVKAGDLIARIADYPPRGHTGDHLHFDVAVCNLCGNPGYWTGMDIGALERNFVDPMLFAFQRQETEYVVVPSAGARVRAMASVDAPIIGVLPHGTRIVAERHNADWVRVDAVVSAKIGDIELAPRQIQGFVRLDVLRMIEP